MKPRPKLLPSWLADRLDERLDGRYSAVAEHASIFDHMDWRLEVNPFDSTLLMAECNECRLRWNIGRETVPRKERPWP